MRRVAWLTLFPLACAFRDRVPIVAWSSHSSNTLDSLAARSKTFIQSSQFDVFWEGDELCQYDVVIIAEQPGLHASDLRALSQSSYLSTRLSAATSSLQVPYVLHDGSGSFDEFKRMFVDRCGARRVELELGQRGVNLQEGEKQVVCVSMPSMEGVYGERKDVIRDHETQLSADISGFTSLFPKHLVIYIGSHPVTKRQEPDPEGLPSRPKTNTTFEFASAFAPINTTLPEGSLFQRYRFFTPGLITALLVVFGLLIPMLMIGIYALASIQSPLRMDAPRGPSLEKKNQ